MVLPPAGDSGVTRGFWTAEVAVLLAWTHAQILAGWARNDDHVHNPFEGALRSMADPRVIFYSGVAGHVAVGLFYAALPVGGLDMGSRVLAYGGPALLALVLLLTGAYIGYRIPAGPVTLRVAGSFTRSPTRSRSRSKKTSCRRTPIACCTRSGR